MWDKHGEKVERGGLPSIAPLAIENPTRADLAKWLTSAENPLTARVWVNHLWQLCFGTGLVKTTEDFGLQGERPSHPELLDWLAVECIDSDWNVKHLIKLMVMSSTYRQRSQVDEPSLARDPENRLLSRGARFRLPAWMLRDAALHASRFVSSDNRWAAGKALSTQGCLGREFHGKVHLRAQRRASPVSQDTLCVLETQHRTDLPFDSAQRRSCEVRTPRTNTPLQSLTLLNDENYLEASRALAALVNSKPEPIREMFMRVLSREASESEMTVLSREHERALKHYLQHSGDAETFLARGQFSPESSLPAPEFAAYTIIASMLLNLDEALTHE